ncbi:MAG: hypothetical protein GYA20_11695 [Chloroflexi bacterium]|nr:hypothetical protein [Chloroflexota bacterium]
MAQTTWQFNLDHQPHTVTAEISLFGGIRSVQVDGTALPAAGESRFDSPGLRNFSIGGHSFQVVKYAGGAALLMDGQAVPGAPDQPLPARLQKYEVQRAFWQKLSQLTGLKENPRADGQLEWRNRLIGTADNRLVVLNYSLSNQTLRPRIAIFTRFAEEKDLNSLRSKIESDPAVLALAKRLKRFTLEMTVQPVGAAILLPYDLRKTTPEQVVEDIRTLFNVIKKYTRPLPLTFCDWGQCKSAAHPRELVFYNHSPLLVCTSCMPLLEKAGETNQARFNRRTPGLLKAASAGLAVAALVGVFFGIWKVSIILAIASVALFFAIIAAMNRLTIKRTAGMIWLAGAFTLLGVGIATIMEATLKLMRTLNEASQVQYGMVFSQPETVRMMLTNLSISLVLTALTLWFALHQQQQGVRELTHPVIEHSGVLD